MSKCTIMVIDDNDDTVKVIERGLTKICSDVSVISAENANQALTVMKETKPSLILLDIRMPGLGGEELCKKIRANTDYDDVPIIFLSAISGHLTETYKALGVVDYIEKPFQIFDLKKRIQNALGKDEH